MYTVYALFNKKHNKIYIGQTEDLVARLRLHNDRLFKKGYTARFDGEWAKIYEENLPTRSLVLQREKQLKSYQGRQFIKKYIPR